MAIQAVKRLREWGKNKRILRQIEHTISECKKTIMRIDEWLAFDLIYPSVGVVDYTGMPHYETQSSSVERQALQGDTLRHRMLALRHLTMKNMAELELERDELLKECKPIDDLLASLPKEDERMIYERYVEGLHIEQIADKVHYSRTTVYRRIKAITEMIVA